MQDLTRTAPAGPTWLAGVLVGMSLATSAQGASRLSLQAETVEAQGLRAQALAVSAQPAGKRALAIEVGAALVDGLDPAGPVRDLRLACPHLVVDSGGVACEAGTLAAGSRLLGLQRSPISMSLDPQDHWRLDLPALSLAAGQAHLAAEGRNADWSASLRFHGVSVKDLAAEPWLASWWPLPPATEGTIAGLLQANGSGAEPRRLALRTSLARLTFADAAGTLAGERVDCDVEVTASRAGIDGSWQLAGKLGSSAGQAYLEPVFIDFARRPVRAEFEGVLDAGTSALALSRFRLSQPGVGEAEGAARLDLGGETLLRHARARFHGVDLAAAWPVWGAPWTVGTQWSDLAASGQVAGEIDVEDDLPVRLLLDVAGVSLDSVTGSAAVAGLDGRLSWYSDHLRDQLAPGMDSSAFKSRMAWRSARLWGIEFGATSIPFTATGRHFRLLDPVTLPVFDGGLKIETLRLRHAGTPQMYLRFDAELTPVSLGLLSRSLGWPVFSGTVSGRIPRLELADGFVTLGGNLEASVFDGSVTVRNLRMRDPLGEFPQLFADIDVDRLDLEQVTSTFEFGMITGRLSGRVEGLETFDWMPVAFDARFYSTPGDRSPHRIDQRAVSNLSSLGGGSGGSVTAALQGGFLRFFDSFRYDRIGLSCQLANDVCRMDGVAPAEGGYYIVRGSGLPRIDVIGSQRRVAWTRLVRQLGAMIESPGPVIE